ncbi:MAG: hypothetical protein GY703_19285 [Gammaproteobacteria bacterium]|nr:hypothetical protein [Gammaproteobacteria bacterium]
MLVINRSWVAAACVIAASPIISATASAGELDGSGNVVCALIKVVGCVEDAGCIQGSAREFDLPTMVLFDAESKVIRGTHESGHKEVSPVKYMEKSDEHLILQGVEEGHGWDIAIDTKTGRMGGAVVGEAVSMLVSGTCTAL